jgi:hypothetical protein
MKKIALVLALALLCPGATQSEELPDQARDRRSQAVGAALKKAVEARAALDADLARRQAEANAAEQAWIAAETARVAAERAATKK